MWPPQPNFAARSSAIIVAAAFAEGWPLTLTCTSVLTPSIFKRTSMMMISLAWRWAGAWAISRRPSWARSSLATATKAGAEKAAALGGGAYACRHRMDTSQCWFSLHSWPGFYEPSDLVLNMNVVKAVVQTHVLRPSAQWGKRKGDVSILFGGRSLVKCPVTPTGFPECCPLVVFHRESEHVDFPNHIHHLCRILFLQCTKGLSFGFETLFTSTEAALKFNMVHIFLSCDENCCFLILVVGFLKSKT